MPLAILGFFLHAAQISQVRFWYLLHVAYIKSYLSTMCKNRAFCFFLVIELMRTPFTFYYSFEINIYLYCCIFGHSTQFIPVEFFLKGCTTQAHFLQHRNDVPYFTFRGSFKLKCPVSAFTGRHCCVASGTYCSGSEFKCPVSAAKG